MFIAKAAKKIGHKVTKKIVPKPAKKILRKATKKIIPKAAKNILPKAAKKILPKVLPMLIGIKRKNNIENDDQLLRELSKEIEEIKRGKNKINEINLEQINKIRELEKMLEDNIEEQKRKEIQRKIEIEEEEKKERKKKLEEINKREEDILKIRELLSKEFSSCVFNAINEFNNEIDKWIDSFKDENLIKITDDFKLKLTFLFNELYDSERILDKINNKFMNILNENSNLKELSQMNFLVMGTSGVGKSTLINELFGEHIAEEGAGQRCTTTRKRYESKKYPFSFTDSMGTELGEGHNLEDVEKDTLDEINNKLNSNNPNEHIHGIIYCTTSNRFFEDELQLIQKIREKYDGKKLPIIIVYTKASDDKDAEAIKIAINNFLEKYNEKISNGIFDIEFIKVMAREKEYKINGQTICVPCFGLSNLISTCYKKGEKVYKIAIKNSLIQIAKNSISDYVKNISNEIANQINYYLYLQQNYEPNFTDYISFCFEKITDVYKQKGINVNELDKLDLYLKNMTQQNTEDIYSNTDEKKCMFCNKTPINPYCCDFCKSLACENCYLEKFQNADKVICLNCETSDFSPQNNIIDENYNNNDTINDDKVLDNNLNNQSKKAIENYSREFKTEMIKIVKIKFDEFTQKASKNIYYQILDKYRDNSLGQGINIQDAMKSKEDLTKEAINMINKELKESAEEKFLTENASSLYQDIVLSFNEEIIKKIDEFINNININKDFINFVYNCGIFDERKSLKIETQFNEYIKSLKEKEKESQEKAVKLQYGDTLDECGESSFSSRSETLSKSSGSSK